MTSIVYIGKKILTSYVCIYIYNYELYHCDIVVVSART